MFGNPSVSFADTSPYTGEALDEISALRFAKIYYFSLLNLLCYNILNTKVVGEWQSKRT